MSIAKEYLISIHEYKTNSIQTVYYLFMLLKNYEYINSFSNVLHLLLLLLLNSIGTKGTHVLTYAHRIDGNEASRVLRHIAAMLVH